MNALVITAATARLASLIAQDEITEPLRQKVGQWAAGAEYGSLRERVNYLVGCTKCSSVWAGGIILALWAFPAGRIVVKILAASQGALTLLTVVDRLET